MTELEFKIIQATCDEKPYFGWFFPRLKPYAEKPSIAVAAIQKLLDEGLIECFYHGKDREHTKYPNRNIEDIKYSIENRQWDDFIGMTPKGCEEWEKHFLEFNNQLPDWSDYYCINYNDQTIQSLSKDICYEELDSLKSYYLNRENDPDEGYFIIDSYLHTKINGFQATYYKYLEGGHCIKFTLKPQEEK